MYDRRVLLYGLASVMIYLLVFLSGFAGLVYEVLWMKQLGLLFGNTSHAAATTLAAFFAGLAMGSWFWGKRAERMKNPLRAYAWLEVGIAMTALLYFVILAIYYRIYPLLYQRMDSAALLLGVKFLLALLLVFPPAFFMGGTIPVMGQHVIRRLSRFGTMSALLYGINTLGAAIGAGLAGFFLPLWLGFKVTCLAAMAVTGTIAVIAFKLSARSVSNKVAAAEKKDAARGVPTARWALLLVCFLSGFGVLALEVVWTRMFSQVLENSVYTFAAILVVVLVCLAIGAAISSWLARLAVSARGVLSGLLLLGSIMVAVTPFIFMRLTNSLQILVSMGTWPEYIALIFRNVVYTIAGPAVVLGMVFPFLMKVEERHAESAGKSLGVLAAINTAGAILGSLVCGFILLDVFGMWQTMQLLGSLYLVTALLLSPGWSVGSIMFRGTCALLLLLAFTALSPVDLPVNSVDRLRPDEVILETWEASDCTVAVAEGEQGLSIKINSHYGLGATGAALQEKLQADLPLMVYPETRSIFFLGVGTGITAGSALDSQFPNVERIVACELVPEVITAAKKYITHYRGHDFTGGLFTDPRAKVLIEDGRHYLMATEERFDMINADLFVPFRSGAGSLYSREHFESAKERLKPGGVFFQWLPLYQLTENEVHIIARTMLEVFDQVTLWRDNFQPGEEVIAIAGHREAGPLPATELDSREDKQIAIEGKTHRDLTRLALPFNPQTILLFYCGNLTEARDIFADAGVNTDDRPLIEYLAPRSYRNRKDASVPWFVGPRLARLVEAVQERCPVETDPFLVNRSAEDRRLPLAGRAFHWARIWEVIGDEAECQKAWQQFTAEWLPPREAD